MNLEKMKKMAGGLEKFAGVLQKSIVICMIAAVCVTAIWHIWGYKAADGMFVKHITVNYTFDAGFLVVFAILMLVAWIFAYGAELQKLSDETL